MTPGLAVEYLAGTAMFQDRGRRALVPAGVPRSGPMDPVAHMGALRLVSAPISSPTVEFVGRVGLRVLAPKEPRDGPTSVVNQFAGVLAACGEVQIRVAGSPAPAWTAVACQPGDEVELVTSSGFGYLAMLGMLAEQHLGSSATCLLGGLGPRPLRARDVIELAPTRGVGHACVGSFIRPPSAQGPLAVVAGPHGRPAPGAFEVMALDRIGVRIRAAGVAGSAGAAAATTLPSLGVVPGAIQQLPNGDMMILGPDAGTMGGYPVVGVISDCDLWRLGRLRVGESVRFREVPPDPASTPPMPAVVRPLV